jgi:hypothetical protein
MDDAVGVDAFDGRHRHCHYLEGGQSYGMQILGVDAAGGQGGADTALAPSKSIGMVVRTIHSDDEVLFDDDISLQRRLRAFSSIGSVAGMPPVVGH